MITIDISKKMPNKFLIYQLLIWFELSFRSSKISLRNGVLSKETFENDNKKRMISLKICFIAWLLELLSSIFAMLTPLFMSFGVTNRHYPDAIIMFIMIPFIHLMNDAETKSVIYEKSWYRGLRHTLGIWKTKLIHYLPEKLLVYYKLNFIYQNYKLIMYF